MPRFASVSALVVTLLLVVAPVAAGEEDETRITAAGQAGLLSMDAFGTSGDVFAYGGRLAVADGLNRWLEVGVDLSYLTQQNVSFARPMVGGVSGDDLVAYADVHAFEVAAAMRYLVGASLVRHFARFHPTVELRGGVVMRYLPRAAVFTVDGLSVDTLATEQTYHPFVGASVGTTFRIGDRLQLGLLATSTFASTHRALGFAVELSWQRDTIF